MRKPTEVRSLLRRGGRARCEIRAAPDGGGGYTLWVVADTDRGGRAQPMNRDDGSPMRFADPVQARSKATELGFPPRWIRVVRPAP